MLEAATTTTTIDSQSLPDRIRLAQQYDVERLQQDVLSIVSSLTQQSYIYYCPIILATGIQNPASQHWDELAMLQGCDYLQAIFRSFKTEITSIRLMRLESGAELKEHTDPTLDAAHREVVRLTLPVFCDERVLFLLNGTEVPMKPGELWYLKLSDRHSVHNNSPYERINMSIDIAWNDWVSDLCSCSPLISKQQTVKTVLMPQDQ